MERDGGRGYVLHLGEGLAGYDSSVKASRASTNGMLTVIESRMRGGAPWHVHSREDECFYVLEGEIIVHCGDEVWNAGPHAFVFLPRGIPHAWDVVGGEATVLMITVPAMLEEFLREFHAADADKRDEVAAKYGMTFLRPM
ncbi:MAG TPA: cupin domain-containing protein [Anaerolineae bacterium]|nr:cupin domain-containing protein [Anaerolineae bacterium]